MVAPVRARRFFLAGALMSTVGVRTTAFSKTRPVRNFFLAADTQLLQSDRVGRKITVRRRHLRTTSDFNSAPRNVAELSDSKNSIVAADPEVPDHVDDAAYADIIREDMAHCWRGYRAKAWGHDNVKPVSGRGDDWIGWGVQIIESLDTLYLMGLQGEWREGVNFLLSDLVKGQYAEALRKGPQTMFEIVIRALGGLVSAVDLAQDDLRMLKRVMESRNSTKTGGALVLEQNESDVHVLERGAHRSGSSSSRSRFLATTEDASLGSRLSVCRADVGDLASRLQHLALDLGRKVQRAWHTPAQVLPDEEISLNGPDAVGGRAFLAEVGSIQMEFRALRAATAPDRDSTSTISAPERNVALTLASEGDRVLDDILASGQGGNPDGSRRRVYMLDTTSLEGAADRSSSTADESEDAIAAATAADLAALVPVSKTAFHKTAEVVAPPAGSLVVKRRKSSTTPSSGTSKRNQSLSGDHRATTQKSVVVENPLAYQKQSQHKSSSSLLVTEPPGLVGDELFWDPGSKRMLFSGRVSVSAQADSYFEYLLKLWIQGGKRDDRLLEAFRNSMRDMRDRLVRYSSTTSVVDEDQEHGGYSSAEVEAPTETLGETPSASAPATQDALKRELQQGETAFLGFEDYPGGPLERRMDHLTCFIPGLLALASHEVPDPDPEWPRLSRGLMKGCVRMYVEQESFGLSPEYIWWDERDNRIAFPTRSQNPEGSQNLLRPETLESLYYLSRFADNPTDAKRYKHYGRFILDRLRKNSKTRYGYSSVDLLDGTKMDSQESFFMAETLKYGYLLFAPRDTLDLSRFVLSTEAHPFLRSPDTAALQAATQDPEAEEATAVAHVSRVCSVSQSSAKSRLGNGHKAQRAVGTPEDWGQDFLSAMFAR
ncbi:unnamed protein product [Amoebophrya sp. A25]|nr:unnamed protein product [Amoebophrya sp. A25]|eukprot:GSA25T00004368001.1